MIVKELQLRAYPYKSRKGLSERITRDHFMKRGYEVFRGTMVLGKEWSFNYEKYENVKNKYDRFEAILARKLRLRLWNFRSDVMSVGGLPDFFVYRDEHDHFFVEVKLEHEQVKEHQLQCMSLLEDYGFRVIVMRVKSRPYRIETQIELSGDIKENLKLKNRKVLKRQQKIKLRY